MKRHQVLNEEERRKRFSEKRGEENNLIESVDIEEDDAIDETLISEDEPDFLYFTSEPIADVEDVEKIYQDLSHHCSLLDPETGLIQENDEEKQVKKASGSSHKYIHKKFQKEFIFEDNAQLDVKKVTIIDDSHRSQMDDESEKILEVEVDVINYETITFSFSTRELENLYTQEESAYFENALVFFKSALHHTPAMKVTYLDMVLIFAQNPTLPPEYFINAQSLTRLNTFL